MGKLDGNLQQRVWQRVQAMPTESVEQAANPQGLLLEELTDEVQFLQLGRRELAQQAAGRAAVLRGLCRILQLPEVPVRPKANRRAEAVAIRDLMGRLLRRHKEYVRLSDHGEFGVIYAALATQTQGSCVLLAKQTGTSPLRKEEK
jgi:hypothetical protein